jgi:membrane-associated phospholipid phosphatase
VSKNERQEVLRALDAWDRSVFREVTSHQSPLLDRALPALTTAADRSVIWLVVAAGLAATGRRRQRRAAVRGVSSVAVTSLLVNQLAKRVVPRPRPVTPGMPNRRPQRRVPRSPSFPSGHAASAAAFAVGAIIELPALAVPLGALAGAVGYSGIYAGIHYPGDVLAGAIAGAGIAFAGARLAPAREPTRVRPPDPVTEQLAPCPSGAGVVAVVNPRSGSGRGARAAEALARELPDAEVMLWQVGTDLDDLLRKAADRADVLAVAGGDGTVNAAAQVARQAGRPLLVVPAGTFNHFAADLGLERLGDAIAAVRHGTAMCIDLGTAAGEFFINTSSLGSYPAYVAARARRERRWGKGPDASVWWPRCSSAIVGISRPGSCPFGGSGWTTGAWTYVCWRPGIGWLRLGWLSASSRVDSAGVGSTASTTRSNSTSSYRTNHRRSRVTENWARVSMRFTTVSKRER